MKDANALPPWRQLPELPRPFPGSRVDDTVTLDGEVYLVAYQMAQGGLLICASCAEDEEKEYGLGGHHENPLIAAFAITPEQANSRQCDYGDHTFDRSGD